MAKLSAHGAELLRLEFPGYRKAYMADGVILADHGGGWKRHGKIKPGVSIEEHVAKMREFYATITPDRFHRNDFRLFMINNFPGLENRVKAFTCVTLMPGDADGCWAELEDFGCPMSLEDVQVMCQLYKNATEEGKAAKAAKTANPVAA